MAVGAAFLLLVMVPLMILPLWALIDLVGQPADAFGHAGPSQLVWALIIIFVGLIGPIVYLTIGKSQLRGDAGRHGDVGVAG